MTRSAVYEVAPQFRSLSLFLSAVERGGASGGEGIQDGCPRRLPARRLRPDEAVLDPGLGVAALLPHAEGEAAAYQSQGALPVERRWREGGTEGGETKPSTAVMRRGGGGGPQHLPPALLWDSALSRAIQQPPPTPTPTCASTAELFPVCVVQLLPLSSFLDGSLLFSLCPPPLGLPSPPPIFCFSLLFLCSSSSSSPKHDMTWGGRLAFSLHVCQVLSSSPPWISACRHHSIPPPLSVVSGVGPSLCAKVPPVCRAPDVPPAHLTSIIVH